MMEGENKQYLDHGPDETTQLDPMDYDMKASLTRLDIQIPKHLTKSQSSFASFIMADASKTDLTKLEDIDMKNVPWWTSERFGMAILWFFGFAILYMLRFNISIAIVSMVDHQYDGHDNLSHDFNESDAVNVTYVSVNVTSSPDDECPQIAESPGSGESGPFKWDKKLQGIILGSFFWGYLCLQVPGGWLSERFGAKRVTLAAMIPVSLLNIVSPFAARGSPYLFLLVRALIGVGESVIYPAAQAFWARWAPPCERSRLVGFSFAGTMFGNAVTFPIGGLLCAYGFDGGWPSVFYVIGIAGVVWCVFWFIFAHDGPEGAPRITDMEKRFIQMSVGKRTKREKRTPWLAFATSKPVWGIIIAHACGNYGIYMLLTQLPTYMKDVLKLDIKRNGLYSMIPYLCFWIVITVTGFVADLIISRKLLSVAGTRKLMSCIGFVGPAVLLVGCGFMGCAQQTEAIVLLAASVGMCGIFFCGHMINHGDIAPKYAGTLFGISNCVATVPGIIAPYVVGALTTNRTRREWLNTFYIAAAVYGIGAVAYVLLAEGEIQPWAKEVVDKSDADGNEKLKKEQNSLRDAKNGDRT